MSLFEKYGGTETVGALVADFYNRVLESDLLAPYFDGVDMDRLVEHQTLFFTMVLGGPSVYSGRSMAVAHAGMGVTEAAFAEVAEILQDTLEDNGVEDDDIDTIMGKVGALKSVIVATAA